MRTPAEQTKRTPEQRKADTTTTARRAAAAKEAAKSAPATERLLRAEEIAARLGVSRAWVFARWAAGELPRTNLGGPARCSAAALEAWIAKRTTQPGQAA